MFLRSLQRLGWVAPCLIVTAFALSGCGLLFGGEEAPAPTPIDREGRALVPTFTPTTVAPVTATPIPVPPTTAPVVPTVIASATLTTPQTLITTTVGTTITAPTTATVGTTTTVGITPSAGLTGPATPALTARLLVATEIVNARNGPGTDYGLAGSATQGQSFDLIAKNQAGDWWQICCINGQQVWIFGQLARVENAANVPVAAQVPPKPAAQAPTPAPTTAPPAAQAPTATPPPAQPPAPVAGDPCAGIGGDGCKFKLRNGPKFAANGGNELKLQFLFIHSGVDGGQPQGSYFVALFKDGAKLPIGDGVRSIAQDKNQGTLGAYNYEYKLPASNIPGGNVAGNYVVYVLDGNGERDSTDFTISVPDGQGEIWIEFDQG